MLENEGGEQADAQDGQDSQTTQQIEEKLAKLFPDEGAPTQTKATAPVKDEQAQSDEAKPEFEEVEFEGQKYQVPPQLKEAFIHKSDYTRKTQEVAEARRQIELQAEGFKIAQAEQTFAQTIDEPMRNLAILDQRTKELLSNWQNLSPDQKSELLYLDKQKEMISNEVRNKRGEFEHGQKKLMGELRQKCADAVSKAIPGWSEALAKEITSHALSDGYTEQELSSIADPRHVKTLWKAREYDKLQALAKAPVNKIIPVVKPGVSNPMPNKVKENFAFQKEMAKAKTESQKARLIEAKFAKQFER